jgi:hypothetical protein
MYNNLTGKPPAWTRGFYLAIKNQGEKAGVEIEVEGKDRKRILKIPQSAIRNYIRLLPIIFSAD